MQWDEVEELACLMLGKNYDDFVNNHNEDIIDKLFYDEYNIDLFDFWYILKDLVKFTNPWKSPITNQIYQGFVTPEDGLMRVIVEEKI